MYDPYNILDEFEHIFLHFVSDFTIVNGLIHVNTMMNFEETQTQTINVEVSDGLNKNSTVVHIAVLPVNEYDPEFKPDSIVWNVTENSKSSGLCVIVS